ncbi:MAG: ABC transporter ATP-binding protein, partial [Romboutsia sp.]
FKSIRFEYKTCIKQFKINTRIYNAPFFLSYFYYFAIRNSLLRNRVYEALSSVGLKHEHAHRYPHEFSGGQRQRIVIARALITKPKLIIADEPISALDVSIQSQVINIMKKLSHEQGVTFLFVAHDLSMVNYACNKMIIMHNGKIVEKGDVNQIFNNPIHPYTISLMKAIPELSRIHVDLSAFNDNLNYEKDYNITNVPKFYKVDEEEHEVFSTKGQFSG